VVGLVLVSHSRDLVRGLRDLVAQMEPDVPVGIAGGTEDGDLGTSLDLINAALDDADEGGGAVILFDLGSAEMTAESALEFLDDERRDRFALVDAPLVEGALAAAGSAGGDGTLDDVASAARSAGRAAGAAKETPPAPADSQEPTHSATLQIRNAQGLHARPAGQLVRALRPLDASVRIERGDTGQHADAASLLGLVGLGATAGTEIVVHAGGAEAEHAIATVRALVEEGFGEPLAENTAGPERSAPSDVTEPLPGAPGLAIGPARWFRQGEPRLPDHDVDGRASLARARDQVRTELERMGGAGADIFAAQAEVLDDPQLTEAVDAHLADGVPVARAWWTAIRAQRDRVAELPGEVFAARAADIDDVGRRVLRRLGIDVGTIEVEPGQIVIADDLNPTQVQAIHGGDGAGAIVRQGTPTSHMAIVARNLGLPLVLRAGAGIDDIADGVTVVVNGDEGTFEINPASDRQQVLRDELARRRQEFQAARGAAQAPVTRSDGRRIEVAANVASVREAELAVSYGADGVGLLRTEFLFADRPTLPSEDEQTAALGEILDALDGRPAIIRTLDIGGDKPTAALDLDPIRNGFLGVRGIRMSLRDPDVFRTQLRALLRLAAEHPVRIMFPFVTTVDEVVAARGHLDRARVELEERGQAAGRLDGVGMMIEVPVAALRPEPFLDHVDFVSVGSNDLFQYLTAAGRTIEEVSALADTARHTLDGLITTICRAADRAGRWVGVCGEIASEPDTAARLIELGVTELSMAPAAIPAVKARLREAASR
jgi:phosphoenolpyruvate-protein phosphotransferase/dihydroxyacetone kinase phosphotransfer subunit